MNVIKTAIDGVLIIEPRVFEDARGYFFESFSQREFNEKVCPITFVQDNESKSSYGVMRGLHFQRPPFTQSKLVRCVKGAVLDVAVDIRKGSPTYGQHVECLLCAHDEEGEHIAREYENKSRSSFLVPPSSMIGLQFFIPKGFAHGFAVLSEVAVFQYKCDEFYHPEADGGISILDDSLGIDWRIQEEAILSDKDTKHPLLKDFDSPFDIKLTNNKLNNMVTAEHIKDTFDYYNITSEVDSIFGDWVVSTDADVINVVKKYPIYTLQVKANSLDKWHNHMIEKTWFDSHEDDNFQKAYRRAEQILGK